MIRRTITLGLMIAAFWLGMQTEAYRMDAACRAASGMPTPQGLCRVAQP